MLNSFPRKKKQQYSVSVKSQGIPFNFSVWNGTAPFLLSVAFTQEEERNGMKRMSFALTCKTNTLFEKNTKIRERRKIFHQFFPCHSAGYKNAIVELFCSVMLWYASYIPTIKNQLNNIGKTNLKMCLLARKITTQTSTTNISLPCP